MNTGQHPALLTDHDPLPTLTLVLPPGMGRDDILTGLTAAIAQVRLRLAAQIRQFQHHKQQSAAAGDDLRQALCLGQILGREHTAALIDEAIVETFDLWRQYDAQLSDVPPPPPRAAHCPARKPRRHHAPRCGRPRTTH